MADPREGHRACLVIWLAGVGIEGVVGEMVHLAVMHGHKDLPDLHGWGEVGRRHHFTAQRADAHRVSGLNAEPEGIYRPKGQCSRRSRRMRPSEKIGDDRENDENNQ